MTTHTHLGQPVRFPTGAQPGDRITFSEPPGPERARKRQGIVLDRAPQGIDYNPGFNSDTFEASGYWLWVLPDDDAEAVRVRYYSRGRRKGEAHADDGPKYVRSMLSQAEVHYHGHRYDVFAWTRHRGRGACKCCAQEARAG